MTIQKFPPESSQFVDLHKFSQQSPLVANLTAEPHRDGEVKMDILHTTQVMPNLKLPVWVVLVSWLVNLPPLTYPPPEIRV